MPAEIVGGKLIWPLPVAATDIAIQPVPGQVAIWGTDQPGFLLTELGGTPGAVTQTSGWETVARPKKRALVEWMGHDSIRVTFQVMLNALYQTGGGTRVERACRMLEKFAGALHGQPPLVMFNAAGVLPHDYTQDPGKRWAVEAVDWGDSIRNRQGQRVRQFADVTLLQFVEDEGLVGLPAVMKAAVKDSAKQFTDAKAGESLRDIAKRTKTDVRDLKKLNDIRDADKTLKTGRRIRVK